MEAALFDQVLGRVRETIRVEMQDAVHGPAMRLDAYREPSGDPGVVGPESVAWRIHADLPGMLVGGLAALMLQTLHPLAMAAVDQHSAFRADPIGRLRRTSAFVAVSTYGSASAFDKAAERVMRVHSTVTGTAPDGRAYDASDPRLLTWVHAAEVSSFAAAYQRYARSLDRAQLDEYYARTAVIAERLGASDVPKTVAQIDGYFGAVRPELHATAAAFDAVRFLRAFGENPRQRIAVRVLTNAAIGVLPGWARAELRLRRPWIVRAAVDAPLAHAIARVLRWACEPSPIVTAATARVAADRASAS